jgi:hypothetical protein
VMDRMDKVEMTFFIPVEGGSPTVRVWCSVAVVRIQYFDFDSREEATG